MISHGRTLALYADFKRRGLTLSQLHDCLVESINEGHDAALILADIFEKQNADPLRKIKKFWRNFRGN